MKETLATYLYQDGFNHGAFINDDNYKETLIKIALLTPETMNFNYFIKGFRDGLRQVRYGLDQEVA